MPSSASSLLRVELQATGENLNTWGDALNDAVEMLEEAIAGVQAKALTGNVTLTSTNYVTNEYRHSVLAFTDGGLSGVPTVTVPAVEKNWIVHNKGATYNILISAGGTAATVKPGEIRVVYSDGTNCYTDRDTDTETVAGIAANVTTVAGISANVTTVAGISANVTTVAGISANVTTVAGINQADLAAVAAVDSEVATVAGIAANVTTVAGIAADVTYVAANPPLPASRTITAGTGLTGGGDLTANRTITADIATDANMYAGASNKLVSADKLVSAAAPVTLTDGATITPDFDAGRVFSVTLGGNRTLANPTNLTAGESGLIVVTQDGTGSRTLSYGTYWDFPGGAPTLSTAASSVDVIAYYVRSSTSILCNLSKAYA